MSIEEKILNIPEKEEFVVIYDNLGEKIKSYSTSDFITEAKKVASFLRKQGMGKGDVVSALIPNSFENLTLAAGSILNGNIYAPLNPKECQQGIEEKLDFLQPKLVIDEKNKAEFKEKINQESGDFKSNISYQTEDPVLILWSSGTTGKPKPIAHTSRMIENGTENIVNSFGITKDFNMLVSQSLNTCGGMGFYFWPAVFTGSKTVVQEGFNYFSILKIIENEKINYIETVPDIARFIINRYNTPERIEKAKQKLSSLDYLVFGGSRISKPTYKILTERFGLDGVVGTSAGETENFLMFCLNHGEDIDTNSCGKLITNHQIKIIDEDGNPLPVFKRGYIAKKSNSLFDSQYLDGRLPKIIDGFYVSGDMGYFDREGNLFITGRETHVATVKKRKYLPLDVDKVVENTEGVLESATGFEIMPNGYKIIHTVYVRDPLKKEELDFTKARKELQRKYPVLAQYPWSILEVESFKPFRNPSGKVDPNLILNKNQYQGDKNEK
ncbi:MAG: acyl--CoA ligase [Nanoarchaeota archaeon]|nr:acyl--CoA ligase [Nanoarchaeota archaeon]